MFKEAQLPYLLFGDSTALYVQSNQDSWYKASKSAHILNKLCGPAAEHFNNHSSFASAASISTRNEIEFLEL